MGRKERDIALTTIDISILRSRELPINLLHCHTHQSLKRLSQFNLFTSDYYCGCMLPGYFWLIQAVTYITR